MTVLMYACAFGHPCVEYLLTCPQVDVNKRSKKVTYKWPCRNCNKICMQSDASALSFACEHGHVWIVKLLLENKKVDITIKDKVRGHDFSLTVFANFFFYSMEILLYSMHAERDTQIL